MNIENISTLGEQLQSLGFDNAGYLLLKRICFKPGSFFLSQKIEKGTGRVNFQLYFEKNSKEDLYVLMYYDAILQKEMALEKASINGVDTVALEKQMASIDWRKAFDLNEKKRCSIEDKASWENEQKIETIIAGLSALEIDEEGKSFAVALKLKYWTGASYHELFGGINPAKNKAEVSQRFYFLEGQAGISVDEAYRFLQNKCLEKEMQAKKKHTEDLQPGESENDSQASSGSGLLKKKRQGKIRGVKTNKAVRN